MNKYLSDFPDVLATFDYSKNKQVQVNLIKSCSNSKIWWKCVKGHEWQARVQDRTRGKGCPACSGRIATFEKNLETERPDLILEWNFDRNDRLPCEYLPSSGKKVWWKCQKGHEWEATIDKRNRGRKCPYCAGKIVSADRNLQTEYPNIASEWHPSKNGKLLPAEITPMSTKKVWWKCKKGHVYSCKIVERTSGSKKCSKCSSLSEIRPEIAKEWHPTKNGNVSPEDVRSRSARYFYWQCALVESHVWRASVCNRTGVKNSGCPFCRASKGEKQVKKILDDLNMKYISQFKFENCKHKRALRFDFAVFSDNNKFGLIEFQGEQHFKQVSYWGGQPKLDEIRTRDEIKVEFCKEESIPLLILLYNEPDIAKKIGEFINHFL